MIQTFCLAGSDLNEGKPEPLVGAAVSTGVTILIHLKNNIYLEKIVVIKVVIMYYVTVYFTKSTV